MPSQKANESRADFLVRSKLYLRARRRAINPRLFVARNEPGQGRSRERKLAADRAYNERHRERRRMSDRRAKAKNPALYLQHAKNSKLRRKARKNGGHIERVSIVGIKRRDGNRCHLCLQLIEQRPSLDHLIPLVRGGAHAEWNLMVAHEFCNKSRGVRRIVSPETKEAAEAYIVERIKQYAEL